MAILLRDNAAQRHVFFGEDMPSRCFRTASFAASLAGPRIKCVVHKVWALLSPDLLARQRMTNADISGVPGGNG